MTDEINLYEHNLELLDQVNPELAALIRDCPDATEEELNCQIVNGKESTVSVNGIQLTSRHDSLLQMQQMCKDLDPNVKTVDVYGVGLGDLGRYLLDQYTKLTKVRIHILNLPLFKILLSIVDFPLDNPKIEWIYKKEDWKVGVPNIIYYPEVILADEFNRKLAERLEGRLDLKYSQENYRENTSKQVIAQIKDNIKNLKYGQDVTKLFNTAKNKKALVVATGPSLETTWQKLKELRADPNHVLIIVDSASKFIHEHDLKADYIVSIDHNITKEKLLTDFDEEEKLVFSPSLHKDFIKIFKKSYIFYCSSPMYKQFDEIKRHGRLFSSGTVAHAAVDLAVKMGMKELILFGFDFAITDKQTHAGYSSQTQKLLNVLNDDDVVEVKGTNGDILRTYKNFRYYLQDLEIYISNHPEITFYNASKTGAWIGGTKAYE